MQANQKARVSYRQVQPHELSRLRVLGEELFVATFGHLYAPDDLNMFLTRVFSEDALSADLAAGRQIWIAEAGQEWIGYCKLGPLGLPIDPGPRRAVELKQLYVQRAWQGTGVADELMSIFLKWADQTAAEDLYISCWSENYRALAFYRRYGFQEVGAYTFWVGNHGDDERILKKSVATPRQPC